MSSIYPRPAEVGVKVPRYLMGDRFEAGFEHALAGRQLTCVEHLRLSFREGFRAGKLYIRRLYREQGIIPFPVQGRMRFRASL